MSSPAPRLPAGTPSSFFASLLACFTFLWNCFPVLSIVRRPRGAGEKKIFCFKSYGAKETRTPNIQLAKLALYQLSYNPTPFSEWA